MKLLLRLHNAEQKASAIFASLVDSTMTLAQLSILAAVDDYPNASQQIVTANTGIDRSTTADVVRRLVKQGLVKRVRNKQDARAYQLTLTAKGADLLSAGRKAAKKAEVQLLQELPEVKALA